MEMELAPWPEYGLATPLFRRTEGGGRTFGGPNRVIAAVGVEAEITEGTMRANSVCPAHAPCDLRHT